MKITSENIEIVNWDSEIVNHVPLIAEDESDEEMEQDNPSTTMTVTSLNQFIDVPDEIKVVKVDVLSSSSVKISWEPPCMNNRPLT